MSGITPVTLDILDASIPSEFNKWQGYSDEVRFANYKETIRTDPTHWERHRPDDWAFALTWAEFDYILYLLHELSEEDCLTLCESLREIRKDLNYTLPARASLPAGFRAVQKH